MTRITSIAACLFLVACGAESQRTAQAGALAEASSACKMAMKVRGTWNGSYSYTVSNGAISPTEGTLVAVGTGVVQAIDASADPHGVVTYGLVSSNGELGTCIGSADRWTVTTTCTIDAFTPYDLVAGLPAAPPPVALPLVRPACTQTVTRVDRLEVGREHAMTSSWTGTFAGDACPFKGNTISAIGTFTRVPPPPDTSGLWNGAVKNLTTLVNGTKTAGTGATTMQVVQTGSKVVTDAYNAANKRWTHCVGPQIGDLTYKWCSVGAPTLSTTCTYDGLNVGTLDASTTPVSSFNTVSFVYNATCGATYSGGKVDVVIYNTKLP